MEFLNGIWNNLPSLTQWYSQSGTAHRYDEMSLMSKMSILPLYKGERITEFLEKITFIAIDRLPPEKMDLIYASAQISGVVYPGKSNDAAKYNFEKARIGVLFYAYIYEKAGQPIQPFKVVACLSMVDAALTGSSEQLKKLIPLDYQSEDCKLFLAKKKIWDNDDLLSFAIQLRKAYKVINPSIDWLQGYEQKLRMKTTNLDILELVFKNPPIKNVKKNEKDEAKPVPMLKSSIGSNGIATENKKFVQKAIKPISLTYEGKTPEFFYKDSNMRKIEADKDLMDALNSFVDSMTFGGHLEETDSLVPVVMS